ncbi:MAG: DNA methylase [Acidobacteria bacterium]|nr:MAG: DNA methylase [Acidobacteriota bacterium]
MTEFGLPSLEICHRARASRDARFDGLFFIAVRSTGIYCRPVCPAPTAKIKNVVYYPTAAAAAAEGYRPCLRCRPELAPDVRFRGNEEVVHRALALIADGALQDGNVDSLALQVAVSARHLRRLFLANTGATPIAVHATRRLLLAKQLLTETALPITQVALAAGFKSLRRFNTSFLDACGIPPSAIRKSNNNRKQFTSADVLTLRLAYRPPLDFQTMLTFLARRAIAGIERIGPETYERYIGSIDRPAYVCVRNAAERSELRLEISGVDPRSIPIIVRRIRGLFDLDADLQAAHRVLRKDPILARGIRLHPGLRVPGAWDGFELAVRAILGQQITVAAATTLARRLVEQFGFTCIQASENLNRLFPTPECLLQAHLETIGLPKPRANTLRALAAAVLDRELDFSAGQRLDEFIERMMAIPGIGPWTGSYVAMRALNHPDAFPAEDLVVQQALGEGSRLSRRETELRAQQWRPWRAYAVLHLWHLKGFTTKTRSTQS